MQVVSIVVRDLGQKHPANLQKKKNYFPDSDSQGETKALFDIADGSLVGFHMGCFLGDAIKPVDSVPPISDTVTMVDENLQNDIRRRVQASSGLAPEERILAGIKQSELAIRVVKDGLRDQFPNANDATIASLLLERIRLMKRVQNRRIAQREP